MTTFRKWYRQDGGFTLALGTVMFLIALVVFHPIYGPRTSLFVDRALGHTYIETMSDSGYSMNVVLRNPPTTRNLRWKSQDTTVARVNQDGLVTAIKVGTVAICAEWAKTSLVDHMCRSITMTSQVPVSRIPNLDTNMTDAYGLKIRVMSKTIKADRHTAGMILDRMGWIDSVTFIDGSTLVIVDYEDHPIKSGQTYLLALVPLKNGTYFPKLVQMLDEYWKVPTRFGTARPQPQG